MIPSWLAEQLPENRYHLSVDGQSIHVMEQGEGRPVLLMHGNPTWGYLWRKVMAELVGEPVRLVVPDLVGLGWSSRIPAAAHRLRSHIGWIGGVMDQLELDDMVVVGQDWGGPVAFGAAAQRVGRVSGLVVLNTVLGPPKPGFKPTAFHRFAHAPVIADFVFRGLSFPQRVLWSAQGDRSSIGAEQTRAYRAPLPRGSIAPLALARMVPDTMQHRSIEPLVEIRKFIEDWQGPAEIVWGDRDPILGRLRRRTERLLPQARVTATDAGHFLQEEVPEDIAAAIMRVVAAG